MWENVLSDKVKEFEMCIGGCCCQTWGYPYDCESIMHYAKNQMSKNGKDTLVPKRSDCKLLNFNEWQVFQPYMSKVDIAYLDEQYGGFC